MTCGHSVPFPTMLWRNLSRPAIWARGIILMLKLACLRRIRSNKTLLKQLGHWPIGAIPMREPMSVIVLWMNLDVSV